MLVTNKKTVAALQFVERMANLPVPPDLPTLPQLFKEGAAISDIHAALHDVLELQKEIIRTAKAILNGQVKDLKESQTKN
jgi:hypothetical protein